MSAMLQRIVLVLSMLLTGGQAFCAPTPPVPVVQEHVVGVRVGIDATGKVVSAQPSDPQAIAVLNQAAVEIARKLPFAPATRDGVAQASETSLFLQLVLEPKVGGQFGIRLKRAVVALDFSKTAPVVPPTYQQRGGTAIVVVSVDVRVDGSVDHDSIKAVRMQLEVPSKFAEARYLDAIGASLRDARFLVDTVGGVAVPARVTLPYRFGGGRGRGRPQAERNTSTPSSVDTGLPTGDDKGDIPGEPPPEAKVESLLPNVILPTLRLPAAAAK
jgi:TonB family protein